MRCKFGFQVEHIFMASNCRKLGTLRWTSRILRLNKLKVSVVASTGLAKKHISSWKMISVCFKMTAMPVAVSTVDGLLSMQSLDVEIHGVVEV